MYLSRFGVKNYKCLGEIDIPLTPIHVLIGENDAGKTSLLEAMAAFCASSEKPIRHVFPEPWACRELLQHGSSTSSVSFSGTWESTAHAESLALSTPPQYGFAVGFSASETDFACYDEWGEFEGEKQAVPTQEEFDDDCTVLSLLNQGLDNYVQDRVGDAYEIIWAISKILKPAHMYSLNAKVMAVPAAFDADRRFRMDPDGFGLATLLDDILGNDPNTFVRISEEFCCFFKQFKHIRVKTEIALERHYDQSGLHKSDQRDGKGIYFETQSGKKISARQASDGAVLFLGFLALAHLPDPPKLLLIEEPENGIYPKRLGEVIKLLKELVNRTEGVRFPQIIMSTHSPYMLSLFEPEEVTFLSRPSDNPDGPVRARPLRDAKNIKERMADGFYLGELWYNLSEEDLFGES